MEVVARTWQVLTRLRTGEDGRAIVVSIEENVSDRANRITRARSAARRDRVHADEDYVELARITLIQTGDRDCCFSSSLPDASSFIFCCSAGQYDRQAGG